MSNYYNGTSAYKINDFEYYGDEAPMGSARENIEKRREAREGKKAEFLHHARVAASALFVFALALGILFTNAIIMEKSTEVNELQAELNAITEANTQTILATERSVDLKRIEDIAINELGMKHPDKYQIVYVNVEQSNYAEIGDGDKKGIDGTMVAMGKGARDIVEYMD